MKKYILAERLTKEERECVLVYSECENKWYADVSVAKLKTKSIITGCKPILSLVRSFFIYNHLFYNNGNHIFFDNRMYIGL